MPRMPIQTKSKELKVYSYEEIVTLFENSLLIRKEQKEIFQKTMKSYFDGEYMVACHLLIPLFESAIRTLAAYSGIDVLSVNKDEGNEYKTLDKLLKFRK